MIDAAMHKEILTALQWYADNGVHEVICDEAQDYTIAPETPPSSQVMALMSGAVNMSHPQAPPAFLGKSDAREEAVKIAKSATTLGELKHAIENFDGIAIKKTASNIVFADGNPKAKIMVIGDVPTADEDRIGKPFMGTSGALLDKILACIGLNRESEDPENAVYITNILNWRPPGNRSPNPAEIEVSLPFIERHIQLIKPEILILCGAVSAKTLLTTSSGISRLRKTSHEYKTIIEELGDGCAMAAFPIYHPSDLINTPIQKKSVWEDMLKIKHKVQK